MTMVHRMRLALLALLTATSLAQSQDVFSRATPTSLSAPVAPSFFGAHIGYLVARQGRRGGAATPWPGVPIGGIRLWDSGVRWADLEPRRGDWNFDRMDAFVAMANARGVPVVYTFGSLPSWASARPNEKCPYGLGCSAEPADFADWERYVRTVAERYKGRIAAYEVWNEPKFYDTPPVREVQGFFSGSVTHMIEMTRIARRVVRAADSKAVLLSPGFDGGSKWLDMYLSAGGASLVDVIAFHFYASGSREMAEQIIAVRQAMSRNGAGQLPLWNTESGFESADMPDAASSATRSRPSRAMAAGLLAQTMVLAAAADIRRFYTYAWEHSSMGMVDDDGSPRPNLFAFASVERWLSGAVMNGCAEQDRGVVVCRGSRDDVRFSIVWSTEGVKPWSLTLPAGARSVSSQELLPPGNKPVALPPGQETLSGSVGAAPIYLQWTTSP